MTILNGLQAVAPKRSAVKNIAKPVLPPLLCCDKHALDLPAIYGRSLTVTMQKLPVLFRTIALAVLAWTAAYTGGSSQAVCANLCTSTTDPAGNCVSASCTSGKGKTGNPCAVVNCHCIFDTTKTCDVSG